MTSDVETAIDELQRSGRLRDVAVYAFGHTAATEEMRTRLGRYDIALTRCAIWSSVRSARWATCTGPWHISRLLLPPAVGWRPRSWSSSARDAGRSPGCLGTRTCTASRRSRWMILWVRLWMGERRTPR